MKNDIHRRCDHRFLDIKKLNILRDRNAKVLMKAVINKLYYSQGPYITIRGEVPQNLKKGSVYGVV